MNDDEPIIGCLLKEIDSIKSSDKEEMVKLEAISSLVEDACLDIAGMDKIRRAMYIKQIAKISKLDKKTIEEQVKKKEELIETKKEKPTGEIDELFYEPDLLAKILQDIDADHKIDYYEKAALFLVRLTGELPNPNDRKSAALKGDSSSGKDNITNAVLKKFPSETNKTLTHTTAAALRKSLDDVRCFAFSELNMHRENGANKEIVETLKQLAEGGVNAEICDKQTGEVIELKSEQKTTIYGTTDIATDEELHTRYIVISLQSDKNKNQIVVNNTLRNAANPQNNDNKENWVSKSIRLLNHELDIIIPFAELLGGKIKDETLFDFTKPRIMRDVKRLISLTKGITWLYQKQRNIITINDQQYLVAEPSDFITAYEITAGFFNLTYSGLDHRLEACYKKILDLQGKHDELILAAGHDSQYFGWVLRHILKEELGINSLNTIKKRLDALKDLELIETQHVYGKSQAYIVRGCQRGVNRISSTISLTALTPYLTGYLTPSILTKFYANKTIESVTWKFFTLEKEEAVFSGKMTGVKLTPSQNTQTPIEIVEEIIE